VSGLQRGRSGSAIRRSWRLRGGGMLLALAAASVLHAEGQPAPLELLYEPATVLVVGRLTPTADAGAVELHVDAVLHGSSIGDDLRLRVPMDVPVMLDPDERHLLAYTYLRRDPQRPGQLMPDPAGAQLLVAPGLEPALFADTPMARELLRRGASEHGRESRTTRLLLLDALDGEDLPLQRLAAAQLAGEAELRERLGRADRERLYQHAASPEADPTVRRTLLEAAAEHRDLLAPHDWRRLATDILADTPVTGHADGTRAARAALVQTAFKRLDRAHVDPPVAVLARWVRGDSPALGELSLLALRRHSPADECAALEQAIDAPSLDGQMRFFLIDYRRRFSRMAVATDRQAPTAP